LLTESLLLSALGTLLGFAFAEWATRMLVAWADEPSLEIVPALDWHILGFVAAVSIAATSVFGVAPALAGTRLDIRSALQASWRSRSQRAYAGWSRRWIGKAFVMVQVSICLMLLGGATLLARSLWNLEQQDWGFRPQGLLIGDLPIDMSRDIVADGTKQFEAVRQPLYEKLNAIPGVRTAALASGGPLGNNTWSSEVSISGRRARTSDYSRVVRVSPRYFETMGIQILAGRALNETDRANSPKVAVLSQTAARRIFDGADPIGKYICLDLTFDARDS
jgi:hypothetical protein